MRLALRGQGDISSLAQRPTSNQLKKLACFWFKATTEFSLQRIDLFRDSSESERNQTTKQGRKTPFSSNGIHLF